MIDKKAHAFVSARYIRTSEAFPENERHPIGVSKLLCVFHKKRPQHFLKNFALNGP